MKKLLVMFLVLSMVLPVVACAEGANDPVADLIGRGKLVIGLDDSFPPMGFRNEDNEIVGFDIDVAAEVAKRLGVEFVAQPIVWDNKDMELASGSIDCIWNGMSITPEREESMAMSFAYLNNQIMVYTLKDQAVDSLDALAGKNVAVQNGSYAEELLEGDFADKAEAMNVLGFDDYLTALMDLQNGGCDAVLMDLVVGNYYVSGMGADNVAACLSLADDNYGIGFRKDEAALRDKVQELLIAMKQDGTLAEISAKWFGEDITVVPEK